MALEVCETVHGIYQFASVIGHGVDGEIAPGEILLYGVGVRYGIWMAVIGISPVVPVGRHFYAVHKHDGESLAYGPAFREELFDVLRPGIRRDVEILAFNAEESVPDAAADQAGLETASLEP